MDEVQETGLLLGPGRPSKREHSYSTLPSPKQTTPYTSKGVTPRWVPARISVLILATTMVAIPLYLLSSGSLIGRQAAPESSSLSSSSQDPSNYYGSIRNTIDSDFPDPAVLRVNDTIYAYSTNSGTLNIPMATSTDNGATFSILPLHDALPSLAAWENANSHGVWAPDVVALPNSTYLLYYASGTLASKGKYHCIGATTSTSPLGPFLPISDSPLICPDVANTGGAIDPEGYLDPASGKRYIAYKQDGNANGNGGNCNNGIAPLQATPIMLQEVDANDGVTLIGAPQQILDRDEADGPLIEAPSLYRSDEGTYFLFFASNCYTSPMYATSYASSVDGIWGPYVKAQKPLLITGQGPDGGVVGPGGLDVMVGGGGYVGFHGHLGADTGVGGGERGMPGEEQGGGPLVRGAYAGTLWFEGRLAGFENS